MFVWTDLFLSLARSKSPQIRGNVFIIYWLRKKASKTILSKVALVRAIILTVKENLFLFPFFSPATKIQKGTTFALIYRLVVLLSLYLYLDGRKKFPAEIHHTRNTFKRNYNFMKLIFHSRCTSADGCNASAMSIATLWSEWNVFECWWRDVSGRVELQAASSELTPLHVFSVHRCHLSEAPRCTLGRTLWMFI